MQEQLRLAIADDRRIDLRGPADRAGVAEAIRDTRCGRGAFAMGVRAVHGARGTSPEPPGARDPCGRPGRDRRAGRDRLAGGGNRQRVAGAGAGARCWSSRDEVDADPLRRAALAERAGACATSSEILERYQQLAQLAPRRRRAAARQDPAPPLVSAIVPYYRSAPYVRDTIESLLAQTYPRLEIVLVNDGSFEEEDWVVAELAARLPVVVVSQMNSGLGAARNFGISQSRGRYVFPLDADNFAQPSFVERCVERARVPPEVAYVTSWSRYIDEDGTAATGPAGISAARQSGAACWRKRTWPGRAAVVRRRLFDLGFATARS